MPELTSLESANDPDFAIVQRGGPDTERLYLADLTFDTDSGHRVVVTKSDFPGVDMPDLIARHRGRYSLLGLFCRPGYRMLDFPCGSGYAAELLRVFGVSYEGKEFDSPTVEYACRAYGEGPTMFDVGDLTAPHLESERYEVVACIEGLEHIDHEYQSPLIEALYAALKPGGTLVVSSPEAVAGVSGPSSHNRFHHWELTKGDFLSLLHERFEPSHVDLLTHRAILSTRVTTTCFYGVCHKPS